jgi:hypothetical protein
MATSFGGDTWNNECCIADATCSNVQANSCRFYGNNETTCESQDQIIPQSKYFNRCQTPNPPVTNTSCTDYWTDSNGKVYYCVAAFFCVWNNVGGQTWCSSGNADLNGCVEGFYSCASNCPLPPP